MTKAKNSAPHALDPLLARAEHAGVYHLPHSGRTDLHTAADALNYVTFDIDLADAPDLETALTLLGGALHFPDWYGHNLDALHDCLTDFSWREAAGYVLLISGADRLHADETAFGALNAAFSDAADFWRNDGIPFWVFYDLRADGLASLPTVA